MEAALHSHRTGLKKATNERQNAWRDRFKQHCVERMKSARQEKIDQRRQEKASTCLIGSLLLMLISQWIPYVISREWEDFKRAHEEAIKFEGIEEIDLGDIEESIAEEWEGTLSQMTFYRITNSIVLRKEYEYEEYLRQEYAELEDSVHLYESSVMADK
ncbi:hypothetical protein DFQ28_011484 [Apophysomyces sp. BC1034]|nr:hypothetical protein DFQ30_007656 [Apophysomyces sp. BC1015]KAG0169000.1 hypothetical protein DFQ29_009930 [Apophysomyces sp. BC1021]KAG0184268.1 hypothetical protein DFQ28_011484 [Apophysomyces sp. BC1034]